MQRGFVEAHSDDGLLEIFGLKEGWHASFVMAELIKAKHIAQVLYFYSYFLHHMSAKDLSAVLDSQSDKQLHYCDIFFMRHLDAGFSC